MLPIINKNEQPTIEKDDSSVGRRQPVLVYNSRVESYLEQIVIEAETVTVTSMSADWLLFMDDLNSEMFNKISL